MYDNSIFIFKKDLRLNDNTALEKAIKNSKKVHLFFFLEIGDGKFIPNKNKKLLDFTIEALEEINLQLNNHGKIYVFCSGIGKNLEKLIKKTKAEAVFFNKDHLPEDHCQEREIRDICTRVGVDVKVFFDSMLNPPNMVLKKDNSPYSVFTPFYKKASFFQIKEPLPLPTYNFSDEEIDDEKEQLQKLYSNESKVLTGRRKHALQILNDKKTFINYDSDKDIPHLGATTMLSAYLNTGVVSIREAFRLIEKNQGMPNSLIRQLYWRDFWLYIAFHFPHVFNNAFHTKYNEIKWENSREKFNAWKNGKTGFPLVDAAMKELNTTGFMHNRVRMVVASFLVKDLQIDWRWGEKYFAEKLIDYDAAINNGNWQWAASTGCDAQPFFRIFNPWRQQERFDPECKYIKKWLPGLKNFSSKEIHRHQKESLPGYQQPMVVHKTEAEKAKAMFRSV